MITWYLPQSLPTAYGINRTNPAKVPELLEEIELNKIPPVLTEPVKKNITENLLVKTNHFHDLVGELESEIAEFIRNNFVKTIISMNIGFTGY